MSTGTKVAIGIGVVGGLALLGWGISHAQKAHAGGRNASGKKKARENPLSTMESLLVGTAVGGVAGAVIYAAARPSVASAATASPTPAPTLPPAPTPASAGSIPVIYGHEYQLNWPQTSSPIPMTAASLQASLDLQASGIFTVKSVTSINNSGSGAVAVVDATGAVSGTVSLYPVAGGIGISSATGTSNGSSAIYNSTFPLPAGIGSGAVADLGPLPSP
jgi:hypothetical protein